MMRMRIDELAMKMDRLTDNILGRFEQNANVVHSIEQRVSAMSMHLDRQSPRLTTNGPLETLGVVTTQESGSPRRKYEF